jgi:hypothetical protein
MENCDSGIMIGLTILKHTCSDQGTHGECDLGSGFPRVVSAESIMVVEVCIIWGRQGGQAAATFVR